VNGRKGISSLDATALFNFLLTCRFAEQYVHDLETVRRVMQVQWMRHQQLAVQAYGYITN